MNKDQLDQIIEGAKPLFAATVAKLHDHILEAIEALKADNKKEELKVGVILTINARAQPPEYQVEAAVGIKRKAYSEVFCIEADQLDLDLN